MILRHLLLACLLQAAAGSFLDPEPTFENAFEYELCLTVYCGPGEECRLSAGVAQCQCVEEEACKGHTRRLCSTDGRTYASRCHMERAGCLANATRLSAIHDGPCSPILASLMHPEEAQAHSTTSAPLLPQYSNDADDEYDYDPDVEDSAAGPEDPFEERLFESPGLALALVRPPTIVQLDDTRLEEDRANHTEYRVHRGREAEKSVIKTKVANTKPMITFGLASEESEESEETKESDKSPEVTSSEVRESSSKEAPLCDDSDFVFLLNNLLLYFHAKFGAGQHGGGMASGKASLVEKMFGGWDGSADGRLDSGELARAELGGPQYDKLLPTPCHLPALLGHGDRDRDGYLGRDEFRRLFGLSPAVQAPVPKAKSSEKADKPEKPPKAELMPVKEVWAGAGEQVQLLCALGSASVEWRRYGRRLAVVPPAGLRIDGASLYLAPAALYHNGNFTCQTETGTTQTHVVRVWEATSVAVAPEFLLLKRGETGRLRCLIRGLSPLHQPRLHWEKNGKRLHKNGSVLELPSSTEADTGSYACVVTSAGGPSSPAALSATASVVVRRSFRQPERSLRRSQRAQRERLAVFHAKGLEVIESKGCTLERTIPGSYISPSVGRPSLCPRGVCRWAAWVAVGNSSRIVAVLKGVPSLFVLHVDTASVLQEIKLSAVPHKLWYALATDAVWVSLERRGSGLFSLGVVREASHGRRLSLSHALPSANTYATVAEAFIPERSLFEDAYARFAYVRRPGGALGKVDLHSLKLVSSLDLQARNCSQVSVTFLNDVGLIAAACPLANAQLLIDVVADVVVGLHRDVGGESRLSPDRLSLVTVDGPRGRVYVQDIGSRSLRLRLTIDEYLPLSSWALEASAEGFGSELVALSPKSPALVRISLLDGRVHHLGHVPMGEVGHSSVVSLGGRSLGVWSGEEVAVHDRTALRCRVETEPLEEVQGVLWLP